MSVSCSVPACVFLISSRCGYFSPGFIYHHLPLGRYLVTRQLGWMETPCWVSCRSPWLIAPETRIALNTEEEFSPALIKIQDQGSASSLCKGPDSKYFRDCWLGSLTFCRGGWGRQAQTVRGCSSVAEFKGISQGRCWHMAARG